MKEKKNFSPINPRVRASTENYNFGGPPMTSHHRNPERTETTVQNAKSSPTLAPSFTLHSNNHIHDKAQNPEPRTKITFGGWNLSPFILSAYSVFGNVLWTR